MRYVIFYAETNFDTKMVHLEAEQINDFEEMMARFTLLSASTDDVLVIEPDMKKVVCHCSHQGKTVFNKVLLDGTIYMNENE